MLKKFIVSAALPVFMLMLALPVSAEDVIPDAPSVAPDLGQEANIITAFIGQQSAKVGEEVTASVLWYPIGEYQVSSSESKDAKPLSANLSITDGAGNFCADPVWKTVFSEYQQFSVSAIATRDCDRLYARIALVDADKKLLDAVDITTDEKMIATPEVKAEGMRSSDEAGLLGSLSPMFRLAIIAVGTITLVGLIAILGRNALRRRSVMTMLLPFLLALPILMSGEEARGVTWGPGGFTVTTNKLTYAPGETILLSGESVTTNIMCTNDISAEGAGASYAFAPVSIFASMGGNSVTILSAQPSLSSTVIVNGSLYARVSGTAALTAPSTPGTYAVNLIGTVYSLAGQCNWGTYPMASAPSSIVITVSPAAIPGICGMANGGSFSTAPSSNLCVTGTASWMDSTAADNTFNWNCVGSGGGITTSCMANKTTSTTLASCGTANGGTFASAPTSNLCSVGTASAVYDYGYWSWTCSPNLACPPNNIIHIIMNTSSSCWIMPVSGPSLTPVSCAANKASVTAPTTYTCNGSLTPHATLYTGDNVGLTANTSYSHSLTNTGTMCEFRCNSGYTWNGAGCVTAPTVDLKVNGSDGPVTIAAGASKNLSWTSINATSCVASGVDAFTGTKAIPSGSETLTVARTSTDTLTCTGPGGTTSNSVQINATCTPSTGAWGSCDCATETKSRTNINASCLPWTESDTCTIDEKNGCRDFNWKEVAP